VSEGGDEVSVARLIADQRTFYRVPYAVCCVILEVSQSWFYKWCNRPASAGQRRRGEMDAEVLKMFNASKRCYGSPRVHADLLAAGWEDQAAQLASFGRDPIVATDADLAGRIAAERDFWMLVQHNINPAMASFPEGSDPADVLTRRGPAAMESALHATRPLGEVLLEERLTNLSGDPALEAAAKVLAAQPASTWDAGSQRIAERLGTSTTRARQSLRTAVRTWDRDPRRAAQAQVAAIRAVRARMEAERQLAPAQRWEATAHQIDPRLVGQSDWPALAAVMQHAHDDGQDVATLTRALVHEEPLGDLPAQDLRYRLVTRVQPDMSTDPSRQLGQPTAQDRPGAHPCPSPTDPSIIEEASTIRGETQVRLDI